MAINSKTKKQDSTMIVALDIGTTKIACMVAKRDYVGNLKVLGQGISVSKGLKKGVVVDIDQTTHAIRDAVDAAMKASDCEITHVYMGIAGSHIRGRNATGTVVIEGEEVQAKDRDRMVADAQSSIQIDPDDEIIHMMSQEFSIDNQHGIKEPLGMSGKRLTGSVHVVTAESSALKNLTKCVERCGLQVQGVILEQLASSESILSAEEKDLGVCLIDIGGGTTDVAIFVDGSIKHTVVIDGAGDVVTSDISRGVQTPVPEAERLKLTYGSCSSTMVSDEDIEIPSVGDRPARLVKRGRLCEIIEARYAEIFEMVDRAIHDLGVNLKSQLGAGVVLTGGGSLMEGAVETAESILELPVRLGKPQQLDGLTPEAEHPSYATTLGLLDYGNNKKPKGGQLELHPTMEETVWEKVRKFFGSF